MSLCTYIIIVEVYALTEKKNSSVNLYYVFALLNTKVWTSFGRGPGTEVTELQSSILHSVLCFHLCIDTVLKMKKEASFNIYDYLSESLKTDQFWR